jgi:hypothetical protein
MFHCNLGKHVQKIGLHGELQSILVFNHLKQAGQREYDKPDSGVNGQIKLMQQDSRVMCVNGPVRAERVWWPIGEFIDGDPISDEKGHLRNRRVIHYYHYLLHKQLKQTSPIL